MKYLPYAIFIFFSTFPAFAGEWSFTDDGCKVWNKLPNPEEKVFWEGKCINGFVEGTGKLTWIDQTNKAETHEGVWIAGKINGFAISTFAGGDKYIGGYVDGEREGWGVYSWKNGTKYIGKFKNGYFEGLGVKRQSDGSSIEEGVWERGKLIRKQKFNFEDF
jgi:hypothetical protein